MASDELADVRMVLIGESGTGKTSLLMSLLEDEFVPEVPPRVDRVLIPADVTPENVLTSIVDCSQREQTEAQIRDEIAAANVICIVYNVHDDKSMEKVTDYWLPLARDVLGGEHQRSVILVGNKSDGAANHTDKVLPVMERFVEVETCVECSAKTMKNVSEIFYYAQKAVVHPTRPLYLADEKRITDKCKKALIRVFKLCDKDNDGLLSDSELNAFQQLCFGVPLTSTAIDDVKRAVADGCPDGVVEDALSLNGFLYLHQLFIERGRHETTWAVLRKFGYDSNLKMAEEHILPKIRIPAGSSTELSPEGLQFVTALFEKYDEDKDGCLSTAELANLFSVCPASAMSKEIVTSVGTNARGWITYDGFIAYWNMMMYTNLQQALELLAYLGFAVGRAGGIQASLRITRDRRIDLAEKSTDRKVFQCLLIGAKDAGKTVFMQSLVGRGLQEVHAMNRKHPTPFVCNRVKVKEDSKFLLIHEVDVLSPQDALSRVETSADVVCLLYDVSNADSFAFCATIFLKYFYRTFPMIETADVGVLDAVDLTETKMPCLIVATKVEREAVEQHWEEQPDEFCRSHELPRPVRFHSSQFGQSDNAIYQQLATMAVYPHLRRVYFLNDSNLLSKITFGAALAALAGFLVYKNI